MQAVKTWKHLLLWVSVSLVLALAIALVAAHAPPPMRRIGLTYGIYGLLTGWLMGYAACEFSLHRSVFLSFAGSAFILIGGGQVGWSSYQQLQATRAAEIKENPKQLAILNMVEKISETDTQFSESYEKERRRLQPQFDDYLQLRYSEIIKVQSPWPWVAWIAELLLAASLGGWILWRTSPPIAAEETEG